MYIPRPLEDKVTIPQLKKLKQQGEKFACLTAYDYSFARLVEECGVEVVLVGDSLGMVIQGNETTIPVTLDEIEYHGRAVAAGLENAMLMLDMPFGSLNSPQQALDNASELLKRTQAQVVKLEGGETQMKTVETMARFGIASCAHLGLQPQMVNKMGGYRVQGKAKSAIWNRPAPTCCCSNAYRRHWQPKSPRPSKSRSSVSAPVPTSTARSWYCTTCST
jgi:3-methyl-2-oxobutanoate hydroxymethyltransferase